MRYTSLMAATAATTLLLTSCFPAPEADEIDPSSPTVSTDDELPAKHFTFTMKGDFTAEQTDITRGYLSADGSLMSDLWVIDTDADGAVLQSLHQLSTDEDFGTPALDLTYGQHTLLFCASRGSEPVWSDDKLSISWGKARDTFYAAYPVEVVKTSNGNRAVTLSRSVAKLKVCITDAVPAAATTMRITLSGGDVLNLATGLTPSATTITRSFSCEADQGNVVPAWAIFTLCPSADEWPTDVTIQYLSATDAVLYTRTASGVKLLQNRETTLTGSMVDASNGFTLSLDDEWLDSTSVEF